MAEDKIEIPVDFRGFKSQLAEAKRELEFFTQKFGETSTEAINAARAVAEIKDNIDDAKDAAMAFTGAGKFDAVTKSLSAVSGGFTAIQGAIGLVTTDSKALQETMLKVQSAMALTQGLTAVEDLGRSFKQLGNVAKTTFKGIQTAIGSTGIGLLMVGITTAIALVIANFDKLKEAFGSVSKEMQDFTDQYSKSMLQIEQDTQKAVIDATVEINELKNAFTGLTQSGEDAGLVFDSIKKKLPELSKLKLSDAGAQDKITAALTRYNNIVEYQTKLQGNISLLKKLDNELTAAGILIQNAKTDADTKAAIAAQDAIFKKINDTRTENENLNKQISLLETQRSKEIEVIEETDKKKEEADRKSKERKDREEKRQKDILKITTDAAFEASKIGKSELEKEQMDIERKFAERLSLVKEGSQAYIDLKNLENEELLKASDKAKKAQEDLDKEAEANRKAKAKEELDDAIKVSDELIGIEELNARKTITNKEDLEAKLDQLELKRIQKEIDLRKAAGENTIALENQLADKEIQIQERIAQRDKEIQEEKKKNREEQINGILTTLNSAFEAANAVQEAEKQREIEALKERGLSQEEAAKQTDAINEKYFEKNKSVQIAQTIIQTLQSSIAAFNSLAGIPVVGPALGTAAAAAALISGYATVDKIKNTSYQSSAGAEGGGGSKFEQGGLLRGPSHAMGGIKTAMGELEGGEFVINKKSTANFLPLIEAINSAGNSNGARPTDTPSPVFKTYVVASEMSSTQEADKRISDLARL